MHPKQESNQCIQSRPVAPVSAWVHVSQITKYSIFWHISTILWLLCVYSTETTTQTWKTLPVFVEEVNCKPASIGAVVQNDSDGDTSMKSNLDSIWQPFFKMVTKWWLLELSKFNVWWVNIYVLKHGDSVSAWHSLWVPLQVDFQVSNVIFVYMNPCTKCGACITQKTISTKSARSCPTTVVTSDRLLQLLWL